MTLANVTTRLTLLLALLALVCPLALGGCTEEPGTVDRVQTNLVDKAIFEGEWWYSATAIDVDYDEAAIFNSAYASAPFEGSMSTDYGVDVNRGGPYVIGAPYYSFPIGRIRWVIDEDLLFAYRSFELVQGGNDDGRSPEFRGQPLAVFAIEAHVDVRKDYNPITGEESNVRVENTTDRRWYERQFMRVDWSQNLISEFVANSVEENALFASFERESVPFFVQEGVDGYPESYAPQFVRVQDDRDYRFYADWPKEQRDRVHYMSFVTQEVWSPGAGCLQQGGGTCASAAVTMRNAFMRVPPQHEYATATMTHREFDRFGIFRSHQPTYARGGQDREVLGAFCVDDSDCGAGGACDDELNVCVGGLTEDRGETDFLTFYTSRHNLYADSLTDQECTSDWECDGRYLTCREASDRDACEDDLRDRQGSVCDPAARRCTIPERARPIRPLEYRLNAGFPAHFVRATFEAVAQWNEALMRGRRGAEGLLPIDQVECDEDEEDRLEDDDQVKGDGLCTIDLRTDARIRCQDENPAAFCFCGSPEEQGGRCARPYDPFESPEDAEERGVPNPYDCYVEGPDDPAHPEAYEDYAGPGAYDYRFVGSECILTLVANSCDLDPDAPCEELGDLRHQFLTHIPHGAVRFGGVAQPLSDPTNGELIVSNANVAAVSMEQIATMASQFFPVLRGEAGEDEYFTGENVRGYFGRLDLVEHPVSLAASGTDGYSIDDPSRPVGSKVGLFEDLDARLQALQPKMEQLFGQEGRAAILSDRLLELRDTPLQSRLDAVIAADAAPASDGAAAGTVLSSSLADPAAAPTSALEGGPLEDVLRERERQNAMAARNLDDFQDKLYNSQYWEYWAEAFDGFPLAEASVRMQQAYFKSIMGHEIGHALGLRHNFAGSLDRDNYHDGYYNLARRVPLPAYLQYDDPARGGDDDGAVTGEEAQRWAQDLRAARQERLAAGAGNVMTSSIMDYDGDLSGLAGVGRYDAAAVMFSYFDRVEAYATPNPTVYPPGLPDDVADELSLEGLVQADSHRRELWSYYRGGETCRSDADCPHAAGSETTIYQPITQRCVNNVRTPNTTGNCGDGGCVCSNFFDDWNAYLSARAYRSSARDPEYAPVDYLFCHDNRVDDLSWCTKFDAGESFQEVVDHYRLGWLQRYPSSYFRNFRRGGPARGASSGTVVDAVKIYQHLFFRFNFEGNNFRNSTGPLGYADQLFASADVLNWLGEIIASPDVGSYAYDEDRNVYTQIARDPGAAGSDMDLYPGQGFYLWSDYQEGLNGFFRLERAGTFLDKYLAIQSLARRDWNLNFTIDERYYINFYDLFDTEVIDLFGGLILRNPSAYAPRVMSTDGEEPELAYLSHYRAGDRGSNAETYPQPAIDGTDTEVLRDAAAIEALATFPIFYDTSFEQRMLVFKQGSGDGYEIPAERSDGTPTCGHGEPGCETPDFIVYDSDRLHTAYVAVVIQPNREQGIDEQQLGYQLLLRLKNEQARVRELQAQDSLTDAEAGELRKLRLDIERDESFVEYLIELGRQFGISSYLY